jgi:glucan phosphoethanolaminetransferase (alkaline phosphatase superfamily)
VSFNSSYSDIIMRFRQYTLMQQSLIAGAIVLLIYVPYSYFLLKLNVMQSISMALYSAILFIVVYYITSSIILRKTKKTATQSMGPKKGLRQK